MRKRTTAVVVTWNSGHLVEELARTLRELQPLCRIIVSDNSSSDGTVERLKERVPEASFIVNPVNGGFGYGNNRAIEKCETEFVLLLNSDARLSPRAVSLLEGALDGDPGVAGVQPLIRLWGWPMITLSAGSSMNEYGRGYDLDFMRFQPFTGVEAREEPCITAAVALFRTEALRRAGGFDQSMFMYFEDVDLCLRMRSMGMGLMVRPDIEALHMAGASSRRSSAERWELISSAYLARKYLGGPECDLPRYWMRREWRSRFYDMLHGRPWSWRIGALGRAMRMEVEKVDLDPGFLSVLLAPRPLRMPGPRPPEPRSSAVFEAPVSPGPGWIDGATGEWGFGCLGVPTAGGRLVLEVSTCNIPGSVAVWSSSGFLTRTFLTRERVSRIEAEVPDGDECVYVVPDMNGHRVELKNARFLGC